MPELPDSSGACLYFKQSTYLRTIVSPWAISSLHIFSQDFMTFNGISRTGRTQFIQDYWNW